MDYLTDILTGFDCKSTEWWWICDFQLWSMTGKFCDHPLYLTCIDWLLRLYVFIIRYSAIVVMYARHMRHSFSCRDFLTVWQLSIKMLHIYPVFISLLKLLTKRVTKATYCKLIRAMLATKPFLYTYVCKPKIIHMYMCYITTT